MTEQRGNHRRSPSFKERLSRLFSRRNRAERPVVVASVLSDEEREVVRLAAAVFRGEQQGVAGQRLVARLVGVETREVDRICLGRLPQSARLAQLVDAAGWVVSQEGWLDLDHAQPEFEIGLNSDELIEVAAAAGVRLCSTSSWREVFPA